MQKSFNFYLTSTNQTVAHLKPNNFMSVIIIFNGMIVVLFKALTRAQRISRVVCIAISVNIYRLENS